MLKAIDLFCGAGGTTIGAEESGHVEVVVAINHWKAAIYTHQDNHPGTRHIHARLDHVDPRDFLEYGVDLIFASPECTHHSNARGGRPVEDQKRAGGWDVVKWVETLRPKWLVVENVREWLNWGPIGVNGKPLKSKKGQTFNAWCDALRSLGYKVEWKLLNAADFGEATSRTRLFVIAKRSGGRIPWPAPTHADRWRPAHEIIDWSKDCPSVFSRKRHLADKTLRRIEIGIKKFCDPFLVKLRGTSTVSGMLGSVPTITAGGNHIGVATPIPFFGKFHGGRDPKRDGTERSYGLGRTLPTIDTQNRFYLAAPYIVPNFGERSNQKPRTHQVSRPLPVVTSHGAGQLAIPFFMPRVGFYDVDRPKRSRSLFEPLPTMIASHHPGHLVVPFTMSSKSGGAPRSTRLPVPTFTTLGSVLLTTPYLMDVNHGDDRRTGNRVHCPSRPLGTLTTVHGKAVCTPFLASYYKTPTMRSVSKPIGTVMTNRHHGLAQPWMHDSDRYRAKMMHRLITSMPSYSRAMHNLLCTMWEYGVVDIGFRMLDIDELARAQGFPEGYKFFGSKADQTKMIGNSVCPGVARAICQAIAA